MFLLGNGRMITRDTEQPFISDGAAAFQNGLIINTGNTQKLKKLYPEAVFLDAKGNLIMPGLINTHNHAYSAMARGLCLKNYHPENLSDILEGLWWNIDKNLSKEQIQLSAAVTFLDCIKNGVTTVFDHHASYGYIKNSLFFIDEQARKAGIRDCLCYEVSDRQGKKKRDEAIEENVSFMRQTVRDSGGMSAGMMGLHASFTLSEETLKICRSELPKDCGVHIHTAEGKIDQEDCLKNYKVRVIKRLYDAGLLGPKSIAAHCVDIEEEERKLLKETDTCVVYNPQSNMGNACGCPDMLDLVHKGIVTGIGTDGFCNDMLESYKTGVLLLKHDKKDSKAAFSEMNQMLYENNAKIASRHFGRKIGIIQKGAAADLIVAEYHPYTRLDASNYDSHIFYGLSGKDVLTTICNGKVLMQNRQLLVSDADVIYRESQKEAEKLWNRMA